MSFRPLRDGDLPLMHRWLNEPGVVAWWEGQDVSWPAVVRTYGSGQESPVEHWLALLDGTPLGWAQCYRALDQIDGETYYWQAHLDLQTTGGIDYLLGEPEMRGRGLGTALIRAFVRDVVFPRHPEWEVVAAGPFEANVASWRSLEKAGFTRLARLDDEEGPCILMAATRPDVASQPVPAH